MTKLFASFAVFSSLLSAAIAQLDLGGLASLNLNPNIIDSGGALIDVNAIAGLLSPAGCSTSGIGVQTDILSAVKVCACVNVLGLLLGQTACPPCQANATPVCGGGNCACACNNEYFSSGGVCVPRSTCSPPNTLVDNSDGTSTCTCATGMVTNNAGGCMLPPSAMARRKHKKERALAGANNHQARAQLAMEMNESVIYTVKKSKGSVPTCPETEETACRLPSGGFECVDTNSSLTSCGGCIGSGGVNCLAIPGALSVECHDSKCQVASCFRGWRFLDGKCN